MAQIQIPNLPVAIAIDGTEELEIVQAGTSCRTTVGAISTFSASLSGLTSIDALIRLQGFAPDSATAAGTAGDIRYDADYIYICTATNTWKRVAIATWP